MKMKEGAQIIKEVGGHHQFYSHFNLDLWFLHYMSLEIKR